MIKFSSSFAIVTPNLVSEWESLLLSLRDCSRIKILYRIFSRFWVYILAREISDDLGLEFFMSIHWFIRFIFVPFPIHQSNHDWSDLRLRRWILVYFFDSQKLSSPILVRSKAQHSTRIPVKIQLIRWHSSHVSALPWQYHACYFSSEMVAWLCMALRRLPWWLLRFRALRRAITLARLAKEIFSESNHFLRYILWVPLPLLCQHCRLPLPFLD